MCGVYICTKWRCLGFTTSTLYVPKIQVGERCNSLPYDFFPRYWPFVRGIQQSVVDSPHRWSVMGSFDAALLWRHNGRHSVSNHRPRHCLLNRLFRRRSTSKLRVTGLCAGNSPGTGEFPAQMTSNAENVCIWWRHHGLWCWPPYAVKPTIE